MSLPLSCTLPISKIGKRTMSCSSLHQSHTLHEKINGHPSASSASEHGHRTALLRAPRTAHALCLGSSLSSPCGMHGSMLCKVSISSSVLSTSSVQHHGPVSPTIAQATSYAPSPASPSSLQWQCTPPVCQSFCPFVTHG